MNSDDPFFMFIGSVDREGATSKLKASGTSYRRKMLESSPENWATILELLQESNLIGVIMKLTAQTTANLNKDEYKKMGEDIIRLVSQIPHILLVHEAVLSDKEGGSTRYPSKHLSPILDNTGTIIDFEWEEDYGNSFFFSPSESSRENLRYLTEKYETNLIPYTTNAEVSVITSNFIQDYDKELLFRIYVPTTRMGASEADKLLTMFREWMGRLKGHKVRQDGYSTGQGRVYEFYSDGANENNDLTGELRQFSDFLDLCLQDPNAAADLLQNTGLSSTEATKLIRRFAIDSRRLTIDLKYERETKLLAIRHQLEAEMLELGSSANGMDEIVQSLVPQVQDMIATVLNRTQPSSNDHGFDRIVVNQQFIEHAQGVIAQEVSGTVNLSPDGKKLIELVSAHGGHSSPVLQSAVHELEDEDAPQNMRLAAGKKLQGFLFKIGTKLEEVAMTAAQSYIEAKLSA